MAHKGLKELMAEAGAAVEQIDVGTAMGMLGDEDVLFVDVRESHERQHGYIPGSVHAPRGFLEFAADPAGPMHEPALASGRTLVVYCGSGGRSALAAKTLHDMGIPNLRNMTGGVMAWSQAGGAMES
jgi:rhodanese-related sulfurtransferase